MRGYLAAIAPLALLLTTVVPGQASGAPVALAEVWDGGWETDGASVLQGMAVRFSAERSFGDDLTFAWDMDNTTDSDSDGDPTNDADATGANVTWAFTRMDGSIGYVNLSLTLFAEGADGNDTDTLWINVTENLPPFLGASACTAIVGQEIDLTDHMSISDPEGMPLRLTVDLDTAVDSDTDGNSSNDADLEWLSTDGGGLVHVYERAGLFSARATLSDGFNSITALLSVSISEAGTEVRVGDHYSNTDTVFKDAFRAYVVDLGEGDRVKLIFRVIQGSTPIVISMPEEGYRNFEDYPLRHEFTAVPEMSEPNGTRSRIFTWTSDADGRLYIVVDNGYLEGDGEGTLKVNLILSVDRKRETPAPDAPWMAAAALAAALLFGSKRRQRK